MKYTLWFEWRSRLIFVPAAMLLLVLSTHAQNDVMLPAIGGGGGGEFVARCPEGKLLAGFELHAGDWVDAIRPLCVTDYGLDSVTAPEPYPAKFGGDGGHPQQLLCTDVTTETEKYTTSDGREHTVDNKISPIVLGMYVGSEGKKTVTVNRIHLICGVADPDNIENYYSRISAALVKNKGQPPRARFDGITHYPGPEGEQSCPRGLVAVGIYGRSGVWLDAVGLICGAPKIMPHPTSGSWGPWFPQPPVVLGRVQGGPKGPPMSICARARDARRRNSPVAPELEVQCATYLESHPQEDPRTVLATPQTPIRINNGVRVLGKPDVNAPAAVPAAKGPSITAAANPVLVSNGQNSGTTTITWKAAPDYAYSEIYLSVDNGEWSEFARGGDNSKSATIKLGSTYTFRMMVYEGQTGTPKVITTLTVTAQK